MSSSSSNSSTCYRGLKMKLDYMIIVIALRYFDLLQSPSIVSTHVDGYFDDESAEVVMSSLMLGDDQGSSLFTNSNWFAFHDDRIGAAAASTAPYETMDDVNLNGASKGGGNSSSDDEVVVGEDEELAESQSPANGTSNSSNIHLGLDGSISINARNLDCQDGNPSASGDTHFQFETSTSDDLFGNKPVPEWAGWGDLNDFPVGGSSVNPFDAETSPVGSTSSGQTAQNGTSTSISSIEVPDGFMSSQNGSTSSGQTAQNGTSTSISSIEVPDGSMSSQKAVAAASLFKDEFMGVELERAENAMENALKEGIVGEAGPLVRSIVSKMPEDNSDGKKMEFNDANYWRVDQEVAILE